MNAFKPLNCALKMVRLINFTLCVFYYSRKIGVGGRLNRKTPTFLYFCLGGWGCG